MADTLGHEMYGHGPGHVLVMHDWFGDCRVWQPARPYLTLESFTYSFADLRGYGRSRGMAGTFGVEEACSDALALADRLGWSRFSVVGHSMTTVVAQRLAQLAPHRLAKIVLVTPVAPTSMRLDDTTMTMTRKLALANDESRLVGAKMMWGDRLSDSWIRSKLDHWREAGEPEAVAAYADLWGRTDVSADATKVRTPMLLVACEKDQAPFRADALEGWRRKYYPHASVASIVDSGHYPMQETPPLFATIVERFLDGTNGRARP